MCIAQAPSAIVSVEADPLPTRLDILLLSLLIQSGHIDFILWCIKLLNTEPPTRPVVRPLCSQGLASTGVFVANESNTAHQSSSHIPSQGLEDQRRRTWTALVYLQSSSAKSETAKGQGGRCAGGWRWGWREGYFIGTQVPYPTSYRTKAVLDE